MRLTITCYCGIQRLLPMGLQEGQPFDLPPCPKCTVGFRAVLRGDRIEELPPYDVDEDTSSC